MKISQLKSLIKESIREVLKENQMSPVEMVKFKVQDFIKNGENWTDSDYMEMTDNDLFNTVKQTSPSIQKAYNLIRAAEGELFNIQSIKQQLSKLLPLLESTRSNSLENKINSFVKSAERWSDSDYEEMQEMSSGLSQKSPKVQNAYRLIRSLTSLTQQERLKKIPSIKQQLSKLLQVSETLNFSSNKAIFNNLTSETAKAAYRMIDSNVKLNGKFKTYTDAVEAAINDANKQNPANPISKEDTKRLLDYGWNRLQFLLSMER
jgi:hypothetical protein